MTEARRAAQVRYSAAWQKRNPEKVRVAAANRRKRPGALEKIRLRSQSWRDRNPEKSRAAGRENYLRHPEKFIARNRARQQRLVIPIEGCRAVRRVYHRARELRRWFDVVVDHVIPLSKGGAHAPSNLQIIYRTENLVKGARLDYTPSVVFC